MSMSAIPQRQTARRQKHEALPEIETNGSVPPATPDKRKRGCMSRRGQVGTITVSGKWYVVRFWRYPVGADRIHASERSCPISGEGYLSKGERRRKANEIVAASGVNDAN